MNPSPSTGCLLRNKRSKALGFNEAVTEGGGGVLESGELFAAHFSSCLRKTSGLKANTALNPKTEVVAGRRPALRSPSFFGLKPLMTLLSGTKPAIF